MMPGYNGEPEELPMLTSIEIEPNERLRSRIVRGNSKRVAPDVVATTHENLFKSGALGKCDDPLCTTCPTYFGDAQRKSKPKHRKRRAIGGWLRKAWAATLNFWRNYLRGVINPHTKFMQRWNKVFVISCLIGVFLDPLFFFLLAVDREKKCIMIDQKASTTIVVFRSITDSIYFMHILLQFRLAYVAPSFRLREPRSHLFQRQLGTRMEVSATREIVDDPKKIAWNYMTGWLLNDLIAVLPLPQVMIKVIVPKYLGKASGATYAKNALRATLLFQNLFRIARVLPLLSGHTSSGFIFETAWANFVINLLLYLLAGHGVGSLWYLFGLQRVNRCLHNACHNATSNCRRDFLDCGVDGSGFVVNGTNLSLWQLWQNNSNATQCFDRSSQVFTYGIYAPAVDVATRKNGFTRYIYSVFWGFQQISTLAGNQIPSLFIWEVLFLMTVIGLGLMLLTLLIGNMQNFLQSFGRRALEMQLRRYEYDKWMTRRHLPLDLQSRVKQYERFNWAATKGVSEDELLRDLPEDLHRTIRRTLFVDLVKKVRLLEVMDEQLLDAIFQRLNQKLYIDGCEILRAGGPVERMLFIVHGTLDSRGEDGSEATLHGGDICGEELLTWCLEHATSQRPTLKQASSEQALNQQKPRTKRARFGYITGQRAISSRTVICRSNVEAFSLEAADLKEVTQEYEKLLRNPRVRCAIRYESNFLRSWAAVTIQVYWRYKRKKLERLATLPHHGRKARDKRQTINYYRLAERGHT